MPTGCEGGILGEQVIVGGFLSGLLPTVSTATRLVLGNLNEFPIPVYPIAPEVCNLPCPEAQSATKQTDEPRFKSTRGRQISTGFQQ